VPPVHGPPEAGASRLNWRVLTALWLFLAAGLAAGILLRNSNEPNPHRPSPIEAAAKPNVVVVMTDDQTAAQMRALPRTRRLIGRTGVDFKNFYVTDPLCCPSRATFLTGEYAHNTGVISDEGADALPALRESDTLGPWLQDAGYRTAFVGKYLNGYGLEDPEQVPPGWTEWHALTDPTSQSYFDYEINDNGAIHHYGTAPDDYKTRVIGHLAVDAIRHGARGDRPLFMYVGFNAPHAPSTPAPRDAGSYAGAPPPQTPAFNEADVSDKPSFIRNRPRLSSSAIARITSRNEKALESLSEVDRQVEKIVTALRDKGELGDTYLMFTSDNGYLDGEHRIEFGKLLAYDPSSRVPLLIRGPAIPNHANSDALVGNIDLAPTIAALANAKPSAEIDGRSLILRLPLRGDPHRALPIRALLDRAGGALRPARGPVRTRQRRRRPGLRRHQAGARPPPRSAARLRRIRLRSADRPGAAPRLILGAAGSWRRRHDLPRRSRASVSRMGANPVCGRLQRGRTPRVCDRRAPAGAR
jgi:N-acetylglucosamine-6-sulfatase